MNIRIIIVIFLLFIAAGVGFPNLSSERLPPINPRSDVEPGPVRAARSELAAQLGIDENDVKVIETREAEWSDSCLGLAGLEEFCAQVITPGYEVLLQAQGVEYRFRTNQDGTIVIEDR